MTRLRNSKRGFTAVELVLVIVVLSIVISVTMVMVDRRRQAWLRAESAQNLTVVYETFLLPTEVRMANGGISIRRLFIWPPLSATPGGLVPELSDPGMQHLRTANKHAVYISPAHPDAERMLQKIVTDPASAFTDESYWYLGYLLYGEEAGLAFVDAYRKAIEETGTLPAGSKLRVRPFDLGDGAKREYLHSLNGGHMPPPEVPVMIERPGLLKGGSNVLFYDGHVEFIEYSGEWPMTEKFIKALESLDELKESASDKAKK